tara:strand:- start:391 stop:612 length:222 start_codon:yes stop_codon:yes gene_type:complete
MSRDQIETAVDSGKPFTILMADGNSFEIPHRDYISIGPARSAFVIVHEEDGGSYVVLPLPTITGLRQEGMPAE